MESQQATQPLTREPAALVLAPTHEQIAARAYERYVARGGAHGDDLQDWFDAERELLRESDSAVASPGAAEAATGRTRPRARRTTAAKAAQPRARGERVRLRPAGSPDSPAPRAPGSRG
jgi:hypothetical protein